MADYKGRYTGQLLGDYHLVRLLGTGGFAEVYEAEHIYLGTSAAIKLLLGRFTEQEEKDLQEEARLIARLEHPHIVRLTGYSVDKRTDANGEQRIPYLVMDYAPNGSLREHHPRGTRLPFSIVVSYVNQIAQAVQYAHERKVVHRDIKPENLLVGRDGKVLLSDFGIAVIAHRTISREAQRLVGSWVYAAPEHFDGQAEPASDQYSLGIVVYEWLCGSRPFNGDFDALARQHHEVEPPSLSRKITISPTIEAVVRGSSA